MLKSEINSRWNSDKCLFRYSILLIVIDLIVLLYTNANQTIFWYDEAYSISLIKQSYADIWNITATDVHPPLYYFLLKGFSFFFGDSLFTLRLFSTLGVLASLLLGISTVKRLFGRKVSFTFILLIVILPVNQYLGSEIRMYSWAMFFVLGCALLGFASIKNKNVTNYIKLTIYAICASYTHYYGLLAVGAIYLYLIINTLISKNNNKYLTYSILTLITVYSLWIPKLYNQLLDVQNHFWIEAITAKDILLFSYYFFSPKEPSHPYLIFSIETMSIALIITLILMASVLVVVMNKIRHQHDEIKQAANFFLYIFVLVLSIGFICSWLVRPIIIPRFTTCILGTLLLSVSIYINLIWSQNRFLNTLCKATAFILIILSTARFLSERKYFKIKNDEMLHTLQFVDNIDQSIAFVAPLSLYPELAKLSLLLPSRNYYLYSPEDSTNYKPFDIKVLNTFPNNEDYLLISNSDTNRLGYSTDSLFNSKIEMEYTIHKTLENTDFKIKEIIK